MIDSASALDLVPAGIVICEADGRIARANAQILEWLSLDDDSSLRGKPFHILLAPAGKIYFETHLRPLLMVEGSVSEIALELRGKRDERRRIYLNGRTQADACGQIVAMHFACFEGSQRHRYEQELLDKRRTAEAYAALVDASPDAIILTDAVGTVSAWNRAAQRMFGYSAADAMGRSLVGWLLSDDQSDAYRLVLTQLESKPSTVQTANFTHADGTSIPVELHTARLQDDLGENSGLLTMVRDITERRSAEAEIRTLNQEIIHRSKNQFAVIQAIARSTQRYSDPDQFVTAFSDRLEALARNLTLLNETADEAMDLRSVVDQQLLHLDDSVRARVRIDGPPVEVPETMAQAVGLALFELSTNALKYGALSAAFASTGSLSIDWDMDETSGKLSLLRWHETGARGIVPPTRQGFGSRLTGSLLERATRGTVRADYRPTGLAWTLSLPGDPPELSAPQR